MNSILLLEDDKNLNRGICLRLTKEGYQVLTAFTENEARNIFKTNKVDLIISDITLEEGNGLEFCKSVRQQSNVYIILLTVLDGEIDIVNGYDIGADDYITKPFSLMILTSKVNAFMRRVREENGMNQKSEMVCQNIKVSYTDMKVYKDGNDIGLSKKELMILLYLMENANQILSKEQILEHVWDNEGRYVDDNTVAVNINRLRNKIEDNDECYIQNVRGLGYIWCEKVTKR
jgi:DNA-binding response OmpR family regulator